MRTYHLIEIFLIFYLLLIFKLDLIAGSDNKTGDQHLKLTRTPDFCKDNFSEVDCDKLSPVCLHCSYIKSCVYGNITTGKCSVPAGINCKGPKEFTVNLTCAYCYQSPASSHICEKRGYCKVRSSSRERQVVNCTVDSSQHCLGSRKFLKSFRCNWTSGCSWSKTLLLSITVGGFGVDRFYLGHWEEGLGKLFSFGGLGVWTLVDIILIGVGYITPADGSLYIC